MRRVLLINILLSLPTIFFAQKTWYVNAQTGSAQASGLSWAEAFENPQQALAAAQEGDQIWVAAGVYRPTESGDRAVSFELKNGVKLYGGFIGNEIQVNQRDFILNETVLSGEIGDPNLRSDNSRHVLYGKYLFENTLLDGFMVRDGYADGNTDYVSDDWGGGVYLEPGYLQLESKPVFRNCRFERNFANYGGAVYCYWGAPYSVNPDWEYCSFVNNRSKYDGGAMFLAGPSGDNSLVKFSHCLFERNVAITGGGLYFAQPPKDLAITHCVFLYDSSSIIGYAGALYYEIKENTSLEHNLNIDSCTFSHNYGSEGGAVWAWAVYNQPEGTTFNAKIENTEFIENVSSSRGPAVTIWSPYNSAANIYFNNCAVIANKSGNGQCAITIQGTNKPLKIEVKNSIFKGNYNQKHPDESSFPLHIFGNVLMESYTENCVFANGAGAIYFYSPKLNSYITNCTFVNNRSYNIFKYWDETFDGANLYSNCYITNCVFGHHPWTAEAFSNYDQITNKLKGYHVDYSIVYYPSIYGSSPNNLGVFGNNMIWESYPEFVDTAAGDFRLRPCSPAVNKGLNLAADTLGLTTDISGLPRIAYTRIDMGAYESQEACNEVATQDIAASETLHISPNPSTGTLCARAPEPDETLAQLTITDMLGRPVYCKKGRLVDLQNIHLEGLASGTYMLRMVTATRQYVESVVFE